VVQGVVHSSAVGELDDSFTVTLVVNIRVGDLAGRAEVILQVLPRSFRGYILDDDAVLGPGARRVSSAAPVSESATARATSAARVLGKLNADTTSFKVLSVEIVNGVIGIPVIVELDESVAVLDHDVLNSAVALKKLLDVSLAYVVGNVPDVNSLARRHYRSCGD